MDNKCRACDEPMHAGLCDMNRIAAYVRRLRAETNTTFNILFHQIEKESTGYKLRVAELEERLAICLEVIQGFQTRSEKLVKALNRITIIPRGGRTGPWAGPTD